MPRLLAALFETSTSADDALRTMLEAGIARDRIALVGTDRAGGSEMAPFRETPTGGDAHGLRRLGLPTEDVRLFEQGLGRGHVLMTARVEDDAVGEAIRILEMFDPVDLDRRSAERREAAVGDETGGIDVGAPLGADLAAGMGPGNTNLASVPGAGTLVDDTSSLGTADLRSSVPNPAGRDGSTLPTGGRAAEERAGAPGVRELVAGRVRSYPSIA